MVSYLNSSLILIRRHCFLGKNLFTQNGTKDVTGFFLLLFLKYLFIYFDCAGL